MGLFLVYWKRDEGAAQSAPPEGAPSERRAGFLTRDEIIDRYAKKSGRDVSALDFYEVLASYKLAIILEGIHARYLMGKTLGEGFEYIGTMVEAMVMGALEQASNSSIPGLRG
jgi:aminoglycoside phosphotransferase (APT) family kinase protein